MIITFPRDEESNVIIQHSEPRSLSPAYQEERDTLWQQHLEAATAKGKNFWNGMLYSFERFDQYDLGTPVITLSTMSYADRIMKSKLGIQNLIQEYGMSHYMVHCGVGIVATTTDGTYLLGRKMSTSFKSDQWSHISGNMNFDEVKVESLEDIYKTAMAEFTEETSLTPERDRLRFVHINIFNGYCNFDFAYSFPYSSTELLSMLSTTEEFEKFQCFTRQELQQLEGISDFEYSKKYLR